MTNNNIISADELAALIEAGIQKLSIVDASWYLPAQQRNGREEFKAARIPGAQYFDIDEIADQSNPLPHMMPTATQFADQVGAMGISERDLIVVYDAMGVFSSARAWWMFKTMGASDVRVLDCGFDWWRKEGYPVETGAAQPVSASTFNTDFSPSDVCSMQNILDNIESREAIVLDARSFERFTGNAIEPREGLRSGHIPGSRSFPFNQLLDDGRLKGMDELSEIFSRIGIDNNTQIITSCGSGVTAAVISLALDSIGHRKTRLYDGSWTEWGQEDGGPVDTGAT